MTAAVETCQLASGYSISRVVRGGWQLAGGHGAIDRERAVDDLIAAFDAGVFTFDCADIYTGVEELYGAMRSRLLATRGAESAKRLRVHTKLVPDLSILRTIERRDVEAIVDRSLRRLKMERLDLVQFHWWDYSEPRWLDALCWLDDLRAKGKVRLVGCTNFDTAHVRAILEAGVPLASTQVQYSVLDRRPENGLSALCRAHGVGLLCYGSVAGGFLSDRWLDRPEPAQPQANRSLVKYKLIIDDFGGWTPFQELLRALRRVADRRGCDIASVASRFALDLPGVAAVIVGATSRAHLAANIAAGALKLTEGDRAEIEAVAIKRRGPKGDVYELERDRAGRHGSIMKYNLGAEPA
ncbi:aldo/keto reductase [Roseiarcus sp.]|uniref:aldo/keto reductase n=1 Tax=Roseiarcus sp. TaxID=1969460 RepID=UPI003C5D72EB